MPPSAKKHASQDPRWLSLIHQAKGWAGTFLQTAGQLTDLSLNVTQSSMSDPKKKAAVAQAGQQLRQWRESAGMTLAELGSAIDLKDPSLIEQAEQGKVALPFEVILRLAAVLGRRDPLSLVMTLTRKYNPKLWRALEDMGIGLLVVQGLREREMANIYRANDAARKLTDAQFAEVLEFTRKGFDMAVDFSQNRPAKAAPKKADEPADARPAAAAKPKTPPPRTSTRAAPARKTPSNKTGNRKNAA